MCNASSSIAQVIAGKNINPVAGLKLRRLKVQIGQPSRRKKYQPSRGIKTSRRALMSWMRDAGKNINPVAGLKQRIL